MKKLYPTCFDAYNAVNAAFSTARSFHESAEQLRERIARIRDELESKTPAGRWRYSEYERYNVAGYIAARFDDIWKNLEFCYRDKDGTLFSTHKESTHRKTEEFYAAGRGAELGNLSKAHVWKGTNRNYTPWEP